MADNVTYQDASLATPPDATVVATDDVGGAHYQRMKLVDGTDGSTTAAKVTSEGNVQAITPNRTATGTLDALDEAVTISLDGMNSVMGIFTASTIEGEVTFEFSPNGTVWRALPTVYIASIAAYDLRVTDPAANEVFACSPTAPHMSFRARVSDIAAGSVTITLVAGTEAGSTFLDYGGHTVQLVDQASNIAEITAGALNVTGTVTANLAAGTNNIGDVDVLSIAAGDNNIGNVDIVTMPNVTIGALPNEGQQTMANSISVAIASNQDVVATAAAQATGNASLAAIETDADAIRVATQLLDDAAVVLGTATYTEATSTGLAAGAVRRDADTTLVGTTNEWGPLQMDANGRLKVEAFSGETLPVSLTSTTITGTVAVTQSGTWDEVGINDSGNSITVDQATAANLNAQVVGAAAHAAPASGNPVYVAGRASAVVPTDVGADGDAAAFWTNRNGATVVLQAPHIGLNGDPWSLVHEGAQYTSAQTSTVFVAGGASEKIVVTQMQIQAFSTTVGTVVVYFGTGAFARGTNRTIFDGEFAPSATLKPGAILTGPFISGTNGDDLMVTTVGDIDITISCWYYLVT